MTVYSVAIGRSTPSPAGMQARLPKIIDSCHQFRVGLFVEDAFWEGDSVWARCSCWRDSWPGRGLLSSVFARPLRPPPTPGIIIAPSDPTQPAVDSGWQAGTCNAEPPEPCAELLGRHPGQFFETRRRPPQLGLHPVHRQDTGPPPGRSPGRRTENGPGRSAGRAQRQPGRHRPLPNCDLRSRRGRLPAGSQVGESFVTAARSARAAVAADRPASPKSRVYNVEPKEGEAARFGLELAGNEVFLEGDVDWSSDYHEGFTIHVPAALPEPRRSSGSADWPKRADPEKPPGLQRPRRRTAPS